MNHEQYPAATGRDLLSGPKGDEHGVVLFILAKETRFTFFQHSHNFKRIAAHAHLCAGNAILLAGKQRVGRINADDDHIAPLFFV